MPATPILSPLGKPDFPDPSMAPTDSPLAIGGSLRPQWLISAYSKGIFPWFDVDSPIMWWSPDPRMVLWPGDVKVSRSMRPVLNGHTFRFSLDTAFAEVISRCSETERPGQYGTWITAEMQKAYIHLHQLGTAHSAEVWKGEELVGGLYGVSLGAAFFGESMFSLVPNASKYALIQLCRWLEQNKFQFIDCQLHTPHLESMGAQPISRSMYLGILEEALQREGLPGSWILGQF